MKFALKGDISKELITFDGLVLVHDSKEEMEFIFTGATPIPLPTWVKPEETIELRNHPEFASYRWPLRREDFR